MRTSSVEQRLVELTGEHVGRLADGAAAAGDYCVQEHGSD